MSPDDFAEGVLRIFARELPKQIQIAGHFESISPLKLKIRQNFIAGFFAMSFLAILQLKRLPQISDVLKSGRQFLFVKKCALCMFAPVCAMDKIRAGPLLKRRIQDAKNKNKIASGRNGRVKRCEEH
jgi:hypothetical protein